MYVVCVEVRDANYLVTVDRFHEFKLSTMQWIGFGNPVGDALLFTDVDKAEVVLNIIKLKVKATAITIKDIERGKDA